MHCCAYAGRMQPNKQQNAIGDFTGKFDHARPGCEQVHWCRGCPRVSKPGRSRAKSNVLASKQSAEVHDRVAHERHSGARSANAPR
jgi:hypothetical protein